MLKEKRTNIKKLKSLWILLTVIVISIFVIGCPEPKPDHNLDVIIYVGNKENLSVERVENQNGEWIVLDTVYCNTNAFESEGGWIKYTDIRKVWEKLDEYWWEIHELRYQLRECRH